MQRVDPTENNVREQVLAKLGGCGIDESRVAVRYDDTSQDFAVIIEGGNAAFSDRQLACVAEMAAETGYWTHFTDDAARARFLPMWGKASHERSVTEARQWLQERGRLADLPKFDPARQTLASYAQQLEVFCGVKPGVGLSAYNEAALTPNLPNLDALDGSPLTDEQFTCLLNAATASNLHEHGIGFGFVGNDAYSSEGREE